MTSPSKSRSDSPVELWYSHRGGATASALAIRKGWLQEEFSQGGTLVRSLSDADSRDIRLSHYHHGQSGLLREGGNIAAIWARSEGQNAVVVAITWVDEYQGILTRADSHIRDVADLKGKRLGLPLRRRAMIDLQRASAQRGFATALGLAGLDPHTAHWVHIQSPDFEYPQLTSGQDVELDALRTGYVDAIFLRGAQGYAASQDPALRQVIDLNLQSDRLLRANNGTPRPITIDRAFLDRHPDIVKRYLAVLARTARWAGRNQGETVRLIAQESPGYTVEHVLGAHGPRMHRGLMPALGEHHIAGLEAQKNFLLEWRYIQNDFDIQQWIEPALLEQVLQTPALHTHPGDVRPAPPQATRRGITKEQLHVN